MKVLYFDCFSGAAGDMILGALLDAGANEGAVRRNIEALGLSDSRLDVETVTKNGIRATKAHVTSSPGSRSGPEITVVLSSAGLDAPVALLALRVFECLVDTEADVHGTSASTVHLHEAGSDDALIDVVGSCAALLSLEPDLVVSSPLPLGSGTVDTVHGRMPVPAPAVTGILKGVPVVGTGTRELVTPTGAALLKTFAESFGTMPDIVLDAVGYGAGDMDDEVPNLVRVLIGDSVDQDGPTDALLLESNIDDMAPELLPYVIERLIASGAQDAWVTPIGMKKNRNASMLSVLCSPVDRDAVIDVLYRETTTLGVRIRGIEKNELERWSTSVTVAGNEVRVKVGVRGGEAITVSPEYEDAVKAARASGMPLKEIYRAAIDAANEKGVARPNRATPS